MEIIIGRISNIDPLTFSEAISLDTYHDKITYSTDSLTWSRGSIIPIHELISVDNELFHRMKLMLRPKKWEGCVSFNRKHITAFVRNLENHFTGKYAGKNFKVVNRKVLVKDSEQQNPIISLELEAPEIASEAAPGQFVVIRLHERGERIPLTIVDTKKSKGLIQIIFQVVGTTTEELAAITKGAFILDILGPLGNPIEVKKYDKPIICIAGGVGAASIYAKVKALKNKGNYIISIIGAKTKTSLILEDEMRQISDELYLTTDDGSYDFTKDGIECLYKKRVNGDKIYGGFVTNVLEALFGQYKLLTKENERIKKYSKRFMDYGPPQMVDFHSPNSIAKVIAVGPIPMMRAVVDVIAGDGEYNPKRDYRENILPIHVSLNPIMVDGTGLCGSCRVRIYNYEKAEFETKFACVDGPTFNGLLVDFESLLRRTIQYKPKEQKSEKYLEISGW
jgi:ferredoxin--NADP+ reductase